MTVKCYISIDYSKKMSPLNQLFEESSYLLGCGFLVIVEIGVKLAPYTTFLNPQRPDGVVYVISKIIK